MTVTVFRVEHANLACLLASTVFFIVRSTLVLINWTRGLTIRFSLKNPLTQPVNHLVPRPTLQMLTRLAFAADAQEQRCGGWRCCQGYGTDCGRGIDWLLRTGFTDQVEVE